jgi:hypothetical protein
MYSLPKVLRARWLEFTNDAGMEIPAFACIRIIEADAETLSAERPDGTDGTFAFNGPSAVADGAGGICTLDFPAWALYDDGDGTPGNGDEWGPGTDTFNLRAAGTGYIFTGAIDTDNTFAEVVRVGGTPGTRDLYYYRHVGSSPLEIWHAALGANTAGGVAYAINTLFSVLFHCPKTITLDRIAITCTAAGSAGHKARLGIYESTSDVNLYPDALVIDAGEVDLDSTGTKSLTISQQLTGGRPYFFALVTNNATPQIGSVGGHIYAVGTHELSANNWQYIAGFKHAHTYGALPDPFPTGSPAVNPSTTAPAIRCRLSA